MSDTITYTTLIGQAKCEDKPGFVAYASSHIEKLQNEGRYDAAIKLKGISNGLSLSSEKTRFRLRNSMTWLYATTTRSWKTKLGKEYRLYIYAI